MKGSFGVSSEGKHRSLKARSEFPKWMPIQPSSGGWSFTKVSLEKETLGTIDRPDKVTKYFWLA